MKIIGKSDEGYLIAASKNEIANLFGFYYAGVTEFNKLLDEKLGKRGTNRDSMIGLEIKTSLAYHKLSWLMKRNNEFDALCAKLRETADAIQDHRPLFDAIAADKEQAA